MSSKNVQEVAGKVPALGFSVLAPSGSWYVHDEGAADLNHYA